MVEAIVNGVSRVSLSMFFISKQLTDQLFGNER